MANLNTMAYVSDNIRQIIESNGYKFCYVADKDTLDEVLRSGGLNPNVVKLGYKSPWTYVRQDTITPEYRFQFKAELDGHPTDFYLLIPTFDGKVTINNWSIMTATWYDDSGIFRAGKNSNKLYDVVDPDGNKYQIWRVHGLNYSYSQSPFIMFHYSWEEAPPEVVPSDITNRLTNCTSNMIGSYNVGAEKDVVLTAVDGYEFTEGATVTIDGVTTTYEPSEDKKTISFHIVFGEQVTITATAEDTTTYLSTIKELYQCHSNLSEPLLYRYNTPIDLVVTANDNSIASYKMYSGMVTITTQLSPKTTETIYLQKSEDEKTATANFLSGYGFELTATAVLDEQKKLPVTINCNNCSHNLSEEGYTFNTPIDLVVTANEGYEMTGGTVSILVDDMTGDRTVVDLEVSEDKKTATASFDSHFGFILNANATEIPVFYPASVTCIGCTHNLTSPLSYEYNTPIDLVVTANDGYEMKNGTVTITTNEETGETTTVDLVVSEDKKTATATFNSGYGFTVTATATATEIPVFYPSTFNLTNCTHNLDKSQYITDTPINLVLTADDRYEFTEAGTVTIITDTETGETTTVDLVISEDKKTATADFNSGYGFTVTAATTVVETPVVPIHYSITITNDGNGTAIADVLGFTVSEALEGGTVKLIPSPNDGYEFDSWVVNSGGITIENNKFTMPANDVSITATFKKTSGGGSDEPVPSGYKKVTFNIKNCTHNLPNGYAKYGERTTIVLTADEGYEFDVYGTVVEDPEDEFSEGDTWNITDISEDKKTASISVLVLHPLTVTMIASKPIPEQLGGLTNIYKITTKQLNEITGKIYPRTTDGTIPNLSALETTGKFFINLIEFPFDIDRVVEDKVVKLGYLSTGVVVEGVPEYLYEIDLGSIHVDTKYNNYYDTTGSVRLFLPYTGEVTLPIEQVVGQTVSVKYIVNLFTGQTTINIYSTLNDVLIASIMFVFGTELPFYEYRDRVFTSDLNIMGVYNGVSKPYIEITRNKPYNVENQFGKPTVDYGKLSVYSGYIECGNVDLITKATADEKLLIQQILKSGVIINTTP